MDAFTGRYRVGSDDLVTITRSGNKLIRQPLRQEANALVHIGDNVFVSRLDERFRKFAKNSTGEMTVQVMDAIDAKDFSTLRRMKQDEHIPFELIMRGERDAAVEAYDELKAADPRDEMVNEQRLNFLGYELMNGGQLKQAQDIFSVNMLLYGKSANVYDSYAEACLKMGNKEMALINYKRALSMDPKNANAARVVAELEKEGVGVGVAR